VTDDGLRGLAEAFVKAFVVRCLLQPNRGLGNVVTTVFDGVRIGNDRRTCLLLNQRIRLQGFVLEVQNNVYDNK
jgi:hypothetical protein